MTSRAEPCGEIAPLQFRNGISEIRCYLPAEHEGQHQASGGGGNVTLVFGASSTTVWGGGGGGGGSAGPSTRWQLSWETH